MTIKLTQKEFDVLEKIVNYVATEAKPYFTTNHSNTAVTTLKEKGLVNTRVNGIVVEVVALDLGKQVMANEVAHEILTGQELEPMPTSKPAEKAEAAHAQLTPQFIIEDDVPMPKIKRSHEEKPVIYPLAQMQVGQSFFVPAEAGTDDLNKYRRNISVRISQAKRKLGLDSQFKVAADFERNGVRVWRKS